MAFKYNNLWSLLSQKNMSKEQLRVAIGASQTTIVKMGKNENVSLDIIDRICKALKCSPNDILEYIPDEQPIKLDKDFHKGDIYLVNTPLSVSSAHEINSESLRPVVIIQSFDYNRGLNSILSIPFTSRIPRIMRPIDVIIRPDNSNNLPLESLLMLDNIRPIKKAFLSDQLGKLNACDLNIIELKLIELLGLKTPDSVG